MKPETGFDFLPSSDSEPYDMAFVVVAMASVILELFVTASFAFRVYGRRVSAGGCESGLVLSVPVSVFAK